MRRTEIAGIHIIVLTLKMPAVDNAAIFGTIITVIDAFDFNQYQYSMSLCIGALRFLP